MNRHILQEIKEAFSTVFGGQAQQIVRAPGRVNLIGEHTDYNDGVVMPMAINRATWIAFHPREDERVRIHSIDYDEMLSFDLDSLRKKEMSWVEYPKGVAWALMQEGFNLRGWEGVIRCDVPMGAGLSSSASFELAVARVFSVISGFEWDAIRMAKICQKAENQWVGVNCGIMDQMISAVGSTGNAVMIDCRSLSLQTVPLSVESWNRYRVDLLRAAIISSAIYHASSTAIA
ncbi:MAG: galactokinase family protein [Verrucomicrobiota bacterium]